MIRRIGLALIATALLLPLQVMAQKGGRSSSHSSRSSSSTRSASRKSTKSSVPRKSTVAKRSSNGNIKRNTSARAAFMRQTGYPKGRKGYVVDHIVPHECGGADVPSNMQWQTMQEAIGANAWHLQWTSFKKRHRLEDSRHDIRNNPEHTASVWRAIART
jgi:hypothetical protein